MRYTLGEAARATGKSKTTIQRAIKGGRVSAEKSDSGSYSIDPAELHRVFPVQQDATVVDQSHATSMQPPDQVPELQAKVASLEALLDREKEATLHLRSERDAWKHQATALLTDQRPKGFFRNLFNR